MSLILHSYRRCPFAIRVRMTLEEKGIPYTVVEENLADFSETLLRLHPEGKVPLLIHNGIPLHESSIITEYLVDVFPEQPLRPKSPLERAQVRLWTYWCDTQFKPDLDLFKYEWKDRSAEQKTELLTRLQNHLGKLESTLKVSPFLMGQDFTLADIHVFPFVRQLTRVRPELAELAKPGVVDAWLEKILARPSFARVMGLGL